MDQSHGRSHEVGPPAPRGRAVSLAERVPEPRQLDAIVEMTVGGLALPPARLSPDHVTTFGRADFAGLRIHESWVPRILFSAEVERADGEWELSNGRRTRQHDKAAISAWRRNYNLDIANVIRKIRSTEGHA